MVCNSLTSHTQVGPSKNSFLQFGENGDWQYSNGTLDEVLLYSDALWTADFTPPTAPFTY